MNKLIKLQIRLCLTAAIAGVVFLANPLSSLAQQREPVQPRPPVIDRSPGASVSSMRAELKAIQARARGAASKAVSKDPKIAREAQAQLASVHADLVAYAKTNGLKLITKTFQHPVGTTAEQSCPHSTKDGTLECTLTKATLDNDGNLHCQYDCVVPAEKKQ